MEEIIERARKVNLEVNVPTIRTLREANQFIVDFIKEKDRIIYGGTAIKALVEENNTDEELIDYDFYSPEFLKDSIELCNLLEEKGYQYVRRINAIHPNTFRIGIDFSKEFLADISYIPPEIYQQIPTIRLKNGLRYADPEWLKMDLYNQHKNPYTDIGRWLKVARRLEQLEEKYPTGGKKLKLSTSGKIPKKLMEVLKKAKGVIALGLLAFEIHTGKEMGIDFVEVMSNNPKEDVKILMNGRKKEEFDYQEYYPVIDILPKRLEIKSPNWNGVVLAVYQMPRDYCLPSQEIGGIRVCDYYFMMRWFYTHLNLERIKDNPSKEELEFWRGIIGTLQGMKDKFNLYQTDCLHRRGSNPQLGPTFLKAFYEIPVYPGYRPAKKKINSEEVVNIHDNDFKIMGGPKGKNIVDLDFEDSTLRKLFTNH